MRNSLKWALLAAAMLAMGCEDTTISNDLDDSVSPRVTDQDKDCPNACDENSKCSDDNTIMLCRDDDADGCKEWVTEKCDPDSVCKDGSCEKVSGCTDACTEDACDGEQTLKACRDDDGDGCKEWVSEPCPENTVCASGACHAVDPKCPNACVGTSECDGTSGFKTCADADGDGCTEWSDVVPCSNGLVCENGACVPETVSCQNECTSGQKTCDGTSGYKTCGDSNGDGCTEWSAVTPCGNDKTCSNGSCVYKAPTCTNACTSGQKTCEGTSGYKTCGDSNGDGCTEWSAVTPCGSGATCSNGECVATSTCTDACTSGQKTCSGTSGYKTCGDSNGDGCTEWSSVTDCSTGLTCSSGACKCKYTSVTDPGIHPLAGQASAGKSETTTVNGYTDSYLYDASNKFKIGARQDWGGSIIFFGEAGSGAGTNGTNTIDGNDTGREVQVAIYDRSRIREGCAYNASCETSSVSCSDSISTLGWNPVQGGNRCNIGSGVNSVSNTNGIMEIQTNPLHWNPNWESSTCASNGCEVASLKALRSDVILIQRLRFVDTLVVELFYTVINIGTQDHTPVVQELPTLYAAYGAHGLGNYNRLLNASKQDITIDNPANDGFYNKSFTSTAPWVTLQNANLDYGVGILYENGLLNYTGWQKAGVFNNVRSDIKFGLPKGGSVNARAYLLLGSYDTIKLNATALWNKIAPFGVLDVPAEGATVSGTVDISGWVLDNAGVTSVKARIDESVETPLTYGGSRPDVCKVWVGYPNCNNVGFTGKVSFSGLSSSCSHMIEIIATDTHGNERVIARRLLTVK